MKNHIPSYNDFVNESELNETGFKTSDMQKTIDYIKKEVGSNPGYAFFGDDEDIEDFNTYWNAKKYKDAFDVMAVASNMELYDFNTVKKILSESKINEGTEVDPRVKKEAISKLSDFFRVSPNALSHLKFDGKDPIKDVTKALNATSSEGAEQYYRVAIQMAKRDLGINESTELNEAAVKAFEKDYKDMETSIKRGIGWIDPEYVADTWENSSDAIDYSLVKGEILKRLQSAGLLWHSDANGEDKGKQVKFSELGAIVMMY